MMSTFAPRTAAAVLCTTLLLAAFGAQAQVQRSFINSSFEEPVLPGDACWSIRVSQLVPGWETTEPTWTGAWGPSEHGTCGGHQASPPIASPMQIFKGNFQGANPASGSQFAELNAYTASRLYQSVCMISGDVVQWQFAHKGRVSNSERAAFNIGTNPSGAGSQLIVDVTTTTTGTGTINSVGTGSASVASNVNNWANYSGSFTWPGTTGMQTVGFQALTGASLGNYLDDIHFDLTPFVEFATASGSDAEANGGNTPQIRVSGSFLAPTPIIVNVVGGTATLGTDYTTPSGSSSFQVIIPAGQYAGALFPLGVEIIEDDSPEDDETIVFELDATSSDYMVLSTQTCGAPTLASSTYTILDDDIEVDLAITKDDGSSTYTPGDDVTYTIVVSNNGPSDVLSAQVTDPLPTGIASATWTCGSATGGGACGAASGSGAINTTADLPAGASVTYTLTLSVPLSFTGNLTNTATVTAPAGTTETDTANNSATDTDTQFPPPPTSVATISCTAGGAVFNTAYDGAGGRLTSGTDTYWQVALTTTPISGAPPAGLTYAVAPIVTAPPPSYIVSPYGNANWISHAANATHPDATVSYDIFYRFQFNIGPGVDAAAMSLDMEFYADNSVFEVWVNGIAQGVQSGFGAADPYFYTGFVAGGQATGTLGGPWQGGLNEIVVHVKSGAPAQAFLAQVLPPAAVCAPATVTLNKITSLVAGGAFGFALTNAVQTTGTVTTTAADTPTQVDGDTSSPGTAEPFAVSAFGTDVTITEDSLPAGWSLGDATCTSGGTPIGSRSGSAYTIPGGVIDASAESFVCTFTNTPVVDLRIDKTASPAAVESGDTVTYTMTLNNDGPGPGDGAMFTDPVIPGVDCSTGTLTCGAETGGAVCPASPTVSDLQTSGITIPTFPAGGSMQFTLTCTVTATGN